MWGPALKLMPTSFCCFGAVASENRGLTLKTLIPALQSLNMHVEQDAVVGRECCEAFCLCSCEAPMTWDKLVRDVDKWFILNVCCCRPARAFGATFAKPACVCVSALRFSGEGCPRRVRGRMQTDCFKSGSQVSFGRSISDYEAARGLVTLARGAARASAHLMVSG